MTDSKELILVTYRAKPLDRVLAWHRWDHDADRGASSVPDSGLYSGANIRVAKAGVLTHAASDQCFPGHCICTYRAGCLTELIRDVDTGAEHD